MKLRFNHFLDWFFQGKEGKWVVIQAPNILLILWLVLTLGTKVMDNGTFKDGVVPLRSAVLFTWSYLELADGASKFRKILGSIIMTAVVVGFFR